MIRRSLGVTATLLLLTAACERTPDLKQVPIGTEVQVTRDDGGLVEGKVTSKDERTLKVDTGPVTRDVPVDHIADVRLVSNAVPEVPPRARFREIHVPSSTQAEIRLLSAVSSETSAREDAVTAELVQPIIIDGLEVIPAGAVLNGVVTDAQPSGRVKGRASLGIRFTRLTARQRSYPIAATLARVAPATKTSDAKKIGIPAAGGAIVGGIIGGKKGAAIGAAAAGGAGAAVVMSTPGKPVVLSRGTVLAVVLGEAVEVRVPLE